MYGHLPPISQTIQLRRTRYVGHWWRSKGEVISDVLQWTPTWPLTSHLKSHPSKMNKTCDTLVEKQGQTHKWRSSMDPYTVTYLPSHKQSNKDEQDMWNTAGEARAKSKVTFFNGPLHGHSHPISTNNPSKMNKTCGTLLEKQGQTHKWRSSMDPYTWMCQ